MSEDTEQPGPEPVAGPADASVSPGDGAASETPPGPAEPPAPEGPARAGPPAGPAEGPGTGPGSGAAPGGEIPAPTLGNGDTATPPSGTPGGGGATPGADAPTSSPPPPPAWGAPAGYDPGPVTPLAPAAVPFTYPPPGDATYSGPASSVNGAKRGTPGKLRTWLPVALVAAVIGGAIGAGVTAIADHNDNGNGATSVVHEGSATPGAAVLSGNVTIPQLVDKVIPAVVSIDVKSGGSEDQGTGMIITSDGEVVTNNHVIELYVQNGNTGAITVTEYGQTKPLPTTLVGYDSTKDVALLKINNASNLPTVTFGNSQKAVVGDSVVAIGNALGLAAGTPTVTQGIVSALGRSVTAGGEGTQTETLQNMIQTDAAINPGNSGGPLIDTSGQVIGMNTAVAGTSSDGTSSQNIGFAIPTAQVESLLPQLQKGGQTGNGGGYLGVDITTLTPALRQQYGFTPTSGAVILSVVPNSPADKAGLVQGDVIVDINGMAITSSEDLQKVVENAKSGQTVSIEYYVGDSKRTTSVTLGSQSEAQQQSGATNPFGGGGFPGFGNSGGTGSTGEAP